MKATLPGYIVGTTGRMGNFKIKTVSFLYSRVGRASVKYTETPNDVFTTS